MSEATDIADILRGFRALKRLVDGEPVGIDPRWVDQANSSLGRRIHIDAVKRRYAEAEATGVTPRELGARIDGRSYQLSQESMAEELGKREARGVAKAKARKQEREMADAGENAAYLQAMAAMQAVRGAR